MLTLDTLRAFGANVDEGLGRCMKNEAFYLRMVRMSLADGNFEKLVQAAETNDLDAAFEALRNRTPGDYVPAANRILALRDELKALDA